MTGVDAGFEEDRIKARLKTWLVGGRVYTALPDEFQIPHDDQGLVRPYLTLGFGSPVPQPGARSLAGEEAQPHTMSVVVTCWGANYDVVSKVAGAVRTTLIGWTPSGTSGELRAASGGGFSTRVGNGSGSRYLVTVALQVDLNLGDSGELPPDTDPLASNELEQALIEARAAALAANLSAQAAAAAAGGIPSGPSAPATYVYTQNAPTGVWTIHHPLGRLPQVTLLDSEGNEMESDIHMPDTNTVIVTFAHPTSGMAFLT